MSYNKVLLIGNVGKDPEVRHLESGAAVATFTLATTERYKDRNGQYQDQTEWHNIVCWRNLAELAQNYIAKGSQIFVEGKIRTRSWTDQTSQKRYTTEIVADNIRLLGKKGDNPVQHQGSQMQHQDSARQTQYPATQDFPVDDEPSDDLPF